MAFSNNTSQTAISSGNVSDLASPEFTEVGSPLNPEPSFNSLLFANSSDNINGAMPLAPPETCLDIGSAHSAAMPFSLPFPFAMPDITDSSPPMEHCWQRRWKRFWQNWTEKETNTDYLRSVTGNCNLLWNIVQRNIKCAADWLAAQIDRQNGSHELVV
jgi:hypothetical protein